MAASRRRASSDDEDRQEGQQTMQMNRNISPASSDDERPVRQTSIRLSRRATGSAGGSGGRKSTRVRRATPIAKNRRSASGRRLQMNASNEGSLPEEQELEQEQVVESHSDDEEVQDQQGNSEQRAHTRYSTTQRRNQDGTTTIKRSRHVSRRAVANPNQDRETVGLSWYERLMPSFMLNMTAPLTGYENEVPDSDVEDEEYAILDRSRIRRNRRIRRRLVTFMLLAAAASLFMYTRGRLLKKVGVKAAVSSMKQRIEDGLVKTVQETMGK